jgi:predicted transcriptional regulator
MIDRLEKEVDMLERHLQVLRMVIENEPIGIVKMSNETGYPHHKVRYSLRVLEEENLIEPSSQGAITTERTEEFVNELDEKLDEISDKLDEMKIVDPEAIEFYG